MYDCQLLGHWVTWRREVLVTGASGRGHAEDGLYELSCSVPDRTFPPPSLVWRNAVEISEEDAWDQAKITS